MVGVVVVGAQWGDEGKGKVIDLLTAQAQHVVRAQGGNNAGHTILIGDDEYKLHLVPSGILQKHTTCYIGSGTVIDPAVLLEEIALLESRGIDTTNRLWISPSAHVIFPYHREIDRLLEQHKGAQLVGTTARGIGPCYADKAHRLGIRIETLIDPSALNEALSTVLPMKNAEIVKLYGGKEYDLASLAAEYQQYGEQLAPRVMPVGSTIAEALETGAHVLFEGAQGALLDISSGTYPFVTSSPTTAGGICTGIGIGPKCLDHIVGVFKAYVTRVGTGPFPTEVTDDEVFLDHVTAREFGTTTGRKRRLGWFDGVLARTAVRLNSMDSFAITKLDILDTVETIKICTGYALDGKTLDRPPARAQDLARVKPLYEEHPGWGVSTTDATSFEELPDNAKRYIARIETLCGIPASIISVGPERSRTFILRDLFTTREAVL